MDARRGRGLASGSKIINRRGHRGPQKKIENNFSQCYGGRRRFRLWLRLGDIPTRNSSGRAVCGGGVLPESGSWDRRKGCVIGWSGPARGFAPEVRVVR